MASKIRCPGCSQDRNSLRVLPCNHQLCIDCITTQCPQCRQPIPCPQSGRRGSNLPLVFAGTLTCDLCSKVKGPEDFWYCEQCVVLMCSSCCLRNHSKDFPEHQIHEWCSSPRPLQHCSSALRQCSHLEDPMGYQAQLKKLIARVYPRLSSMVREQGPSVADVASSLEKAYSLQGMGEKQSSTGAAEKLQNHLRVAKQALVLTDAMRETDQVLPKLLEFKKSPDAIAEILFKELDFGQTLGSEVAEPVQEEVQLQRSKPFQPVQPRRSLSVEPVGGARAAEASSHVLKAFYIAIEGPEVPSVVFGSSRFLALLTKSSVKVWSIESLKEDGNPISVGSVTRETNCQTFIDAAISEQANQFILISKTNDQWDVLIFALTNCTCIKTMRMEQGSNISSACIGVTGTADAYLALNSTHQTVSVHRLSLVPPHHKKEFRLIKVQEMNSMAFKRVAAKCVAKLRHLVAAMEAEHPCVLIFLWNGSRLLQNQTIQLVSPSPLLNLCFRTDEDVLFISSQHRVQWWKFYEGVGQKTYDGEIKAGFASNLGILNGRIVGAIDQTHLGRLRFTFFQKEGMRWVTCNG